MRVRFPLLALLLACLLAVLPSFAAAQDHTDEFVDQIESHFHFKNSFTGDDLSHDALKRVLLQRNGSADQATFLNQGALICENLDVRTRFVQQDYVSAVRLLWDFLGIYVPNDFRGGAEEFIGWVIEDFFEDLVPFWSAYKAFENTITLTLDFIDYLMDSSKIYIENVQLKYYLDHVQTIEGDDEFVWDTVELHLPIVFSESDKAKFHELCKATWKENQSLAGLDGSVAVFRDAVNKRIAGQAVVNVTPTGLYAPTTVTLDGSDSIGPNGTEAIGHRWTVDGHDLGVGATKTLPTYWAVGIHYVTLDVTSVDEHNNLFHLTTETNFNVGAPPIQINPGGINDDTFDVTLHTIKNPKIASYAWDFGDGTIVSGADKDAVTHHYVDGTQQYSVYLRVHMAEAGHDDVPSQVFQVAFHQNPTDWNGGTFQSDTDWGKSQSPYRIHGTLTIPKGVTLTLEPGVVLQFDGNAGLEVSGKLLSKGQATATTRVYLVPAGDNSPPSLLHPGSDNSMSNWPGVLAHAGAQLSVSSVVFHKASVAIQTSEGGLSISGATFENCNGSAYLSGPGPFVFSGNTLSNSGSPAFSLSGGDLTVSGNVMPSGAVYGTVRSFAHSGNRAASGRCDLQMGGLTLTGESAWSPDAGERLTVPSGPLTVERGGSLKLAPGLALFVAPGINNYNNDSPLVVRGALGVEGAGTGPVTLTVLGDDSPLGGQDGAGNGYWHGVRVEAGGVAGLSGLLVRHAYFGVEAETLSASGTVFERCVTALHVTKGGGVLRDCSFTGNSMAIQNDSTTKLDARGCWFGDASGPYNATSNPNGRGNPVSDYVLFDAAPSRVVLKAKGKLARQDGRLVATITLTNSGAVAATGVSIRTAALGGVVPLESLPVRVGAIAPGASKTVTFTYPGTAAAPGSTALLALTAGYAGGSLTSTLRLIAP